VEAIVQFVPAPRLVCIETNPGELQPNNNHIHDNDLHENDHMVVPETDPDWIPLVRPPPPELDEVQEELQELYMERGEFAMHVFRTFVHHWREYQQQGVLLPVIPCEFILARVERMSSVRCHCPVCNGSFPHPSPPETAERVFTYYMTLVCEAVIDGHDFCAMMLIHDIEPNPGPAWVKPKCDPFMKKHLLMPDVIFQMDYVKNLVNSLVPTIEIGLTEDTKTYLSASAAFVVEGARSVVEGVPTEFEVKNAMTSDLSAAFTSLANMWKDPVQRSLGLFVLSMAILILAFYYKSKVSAAAGAAIGLYLATTQYSEFGMFLVSHAPTWFSDNGVRFQAEASGVVEEGVSLLLQGLAGIVNVSCGVTDGTYKGLLKSFSKGMKETNEFSEALEFIKTYSIKVVNYLGERLKCQWMHINRDTFPAISKLAAEISEYAQRVATDGRFTSMDYFRVLNIKRELDKVYREIPRGRDQDTYRREVDRLIRNMEPVINKCKAVGLSQEPSPECLGILLCGPSGTGKSFNMGIIALSLATEVMSQSYLMGVIPEVRYRAFLEDSVRELYTYPKDKFWDGYNNQLITLLDELGQEKDVPGMEKNWAIETIQCVNGSDYKLRVSNSTDKNTLTFGSNVLIATSNAEKLHPASIHCPEAFCRRFKGHTYCVVPKIEYCSTRNMNIDGSWEYPDLTDRTKIWQRRLDMSKVPDAWFDPTVRAWQYEEVVEFHPWDIYRGMAAPGPVLSLSEFSAVEAQAVFEKMTAHEKLVSFKSSVMANIAVTKAQQTVANLEKAGFPSEQMEEVKRRAQVVFDLHPEACDKMYGREHVGPYEVPDVLVPGVSMQVNHQMDMDLRSVLDHLKPDEIEGRRKYLARQERLGATEPPLNTQEKMAVRKVMMDKIFSDDPEVAEHSARMDNLMRRHPDLYREEFLYPITEAIQSRGYEEEHKVIDVLCGIHRVDRAVDEWTLLPLVEKLKNSKSIVLYLKDRGFSNEVIINVVGSALSLSELVCHPLKAVVSAYRCVSELLSRSTTYIGNLLDGYERWVMNHPLLGMFATGFAMGSGYMIGITVGIKFLMYMIEPVRQQMDKTELVAPTLSLLNWKSEHSDEVRAVARNMFRIYLPLDQEQSGDPTHMTSLGSILFVGGSVGITNRHFTRGIRDLISQRKLENPGGITPQQIWFKRYDQAGEKYDSKLLLTEIEMNDEPVQDKSIWVVRTHKFPPKANILSKLPSREDAAMCELLYKQQLTGKFMVRDKCGVTEYNCIPTTFRSYLKTHPDPVTRDTIAMDGVTKNGDCGAIGISTDRRLKDVGHPNVLVFYGHSAKVGSSAIGYRIWKEDFDGYHLGAITPMMPRDIFDSELSAASCEFSNVVFEQDTRNNLPLHFPIVCEAPKFDQCNMSRYEKSPLYGRWGPGTKFPARLRPGIDSEGLPKDPFKIAREAYCSGDATVNQLALDEIVDYLSTWLKNVSTPLECDRVLSFEEAIEGVPSLDIPRMKRKTSPGYRFNLEKKALGITTPGKYHWLGGVPGNSSPYDLKSDPCKELIEKVGKLVLKAENGDRLYTLFMDCLKDERLVLEKLKSFSTRMFCCCELDFLIVCKMYLGTFATWVLKNRIFNGSCIGINPHGRDWEALYDRICSFGTDRIIAGDFSKYDKKIMPEFIAGFFKLVEVAYPNSTQKERNVRNTLCIEFVNSLHVAMLGDKGVVYEWLGANTSGNFVTSIMNCFINILMCLYVICDIIVPGGILAYKGGGLPLKFIMENLVIETYGDDNLLAPSPLLVIDQQIMTKHFESCLNMKYTDDTKQGLVVTLRDIHEVTFLSRHFVRFRVKGELVTVAPLKLPSVLEAPYWVRKGWKMKDLEQVLHQSILELAAHGRDEFDRLSPSLVMAGEGLRFEMLVRTWGVAIDQFLLMEYEFDL
jgi:hypothetical protein